MLKKSVQRLLYPRQGILLKRKSFSTNTICRSIQPFLMPAMSPTMEKGGIVNWKFKPGETFEAGDVLLEVETDKAQIDVEAQDDGQMAKILVNDGAKDVSVGTLIAYLADSDDDLSKLVIPTGDSQILNDKTNQSSKEVARSNTTNLTKRGTTTSENITDSSSTELLPSAAILCSQNNISIQEAKNKIAGSGLHGRILKGDVLAYLNKIPKKSVDKISQYVEQNSKLDLSNIEIQKVTTSNAENAKNGKKEEIDTVEESTMNTAKITPISFTEDLIISIPSNVTFDELRYSMKKFIQKAYHYSHKPSISTSQYFDPIFEDLLTVSPRQSRFHYDYNLLCMDKSTKQSERDIFDILSSDSSTTKCGNAQSNQTSSNECLLTINVNIDNNFTDSLRKANKFINYIKQLESVA